MPWTDIEVYSYIYIYIVCFSFPFQKKKCVLSRCILQISSRREFPFISIWKDFIVFQSNKSKEKINHKASFERKLFLRGENREEKRKEVYLKITNKNLSCTQFRLFDFRYFDVLSLQLMCFKFLSTSIYFTHTAWILFLMISYA